MKDLNSIRENISNLVIKILSDEKVKGVLDKIENDPDTQRAVKKLKSASDELTPAIIAHVKKYPNSRLSKLLKSRGLV